MKEMQGMEREGTLSLHTLSKCVTLSVPRCVHQSRSSQNPLLFRVVSNHGNSIIKSLAIGVRTQSPAPIPSLNVSSGAKSFKPVIKILSFWHHPHPETI